MEWGGGAWHWTARPSSVGVLGAAGFAQGSPYYLSWELLLGWAGVSLLPRGLVVQSQVPPTERPLFGNSCYSFSPINPLTVP